MLIYAIGESGKPTPRADKIPGDYYIREKAHLTLLHSYILDTCVMVQ